MGHWVGLSRSKAVGVGLGVAGTLGWGFIWVGHWVGGIWGGTGGGDVYGWGTVGGASCGWGTAEVWLYMGVALGVGLHMGVA